MKILITGGGSEEPIDNVRSIINFSTGKTSAFLADFFIRQNFDVTLLTSERSVLPENSKINILKYKTFQELKQKLENECKKNYEIVLHAAAVSDYSPEKIIVDEKEFPVGSFSKIPSGSELKIVMKKNEKLLDFIKNWSNRKSFVFGFKLTSNSATEERISKVKQIFDSNKDKTLVPDAVISNDLSEISGENHPCVIYSKNLEILDKVKNLSELAYSIEKIVKNQVKKCS